MYPRTGVAVVSQVMRVNDFPFLCAVLAYGTAANFLRSNGKWYVQNFKVIPQGEPVQYLR